MSKKFSNGQVQIYTGDGKGKTTAALGLALRAAGSGLKVMIFQFVKGRSYGEDKAIRYIKNITIKKCGRGCFIKGMPDKKDIIRARKWFKTARSMIERRTHDLFVLDELNVAVKFGLIDLNEVIDMLKKRRNDVEIVITGRCCPRRLYRYAHLITFMKNLRHPYDKGMPARVGIEH